MCLEDQDNNPVYACHNRVDAEATRVMVVLTPYGVTVVVLAAIGWLLEGIEGAKDDKHEP